MTPRAEIVAAVVLACHTSVLAQEAEPSLEERLAVQFAAASGGLAGSVFAFDGAAARKNGDRIAGHGEEAGGGKADTVALQLASEF